MTKYAGAVIVGVIAVPTGAVAEPVKPTLGLTDQSSFEPQVGGGLTMGRSQLITPLRLFDLRLTEAYGRGGSMRIEG